MTDIKTGSPVRDTNLSIQDIRRMTPKEKQAWLNDKTIPKDERATRIAKIVMAGQTG